MHNICHHIGICTFRPDEMIRFYTEIMGFQRSGDKRVPQNLMEQVFDIPCDCGLVKLSLGSFSIEIITPEEEIFSEDSRQLRGINHWGLGVPDKNEYVAALKTKAADIIEVEAFNKKHYFVRDPDGNLIEIYELK